MSSVFVSYRRTDSTPYAASLAAALRGALGSMNVFFDKTGMLIGEPYPDRLERELDAARACVIVIGRDWLRAPDEHGRRRIDDPNDWVHREVRRALERQIAVPVLVHGASMPTVAALPEALQALAPCSAVSLSDESLLHDLQRFVPVLCRRFDLPLVEPPIIWPTPEKAANALTREELTSWMAARRSALGETGSNWSLVPWIKDSDAEDGIALRRSYRFGTFEDAIHFMSTAAPDIASSGHHPAWSNVWRTVTVRLTTFDIGHRPSVYDMRLAEYLDELYRKYDKRAVDSPGSPSGPREQTVV